MSGYRQASAAAVVGSGGTRWWGQLLGVLLFTALLAGVWVRGAAANGIGAIFVANHGANSVTIIEQANHTELVTLPPPTPKVAPGEPTPTPSAEDVAVGEGPNAVAFSQDGCFGYVATEGSGSIVGIDRNLYAITRIYPEVARRIRGFDATFPDPETDWLLVGDVTRNQVLVINAEDGNRVRAIPVPGRPVALVANRDATRAYVLTEEADFVTVLNPRTGDDLPEIVVGPNAASLVLSADGAVLYVADPTIDRISVVDTVTRQVRQVVATGSRPMGMALTPDGRSLLVVNNGDDTLSIYNTQQFDAVVAIPVGAGPQDVAVHPNGQYAYVAVTSENTVAVLDLASLEVVKRVSVRERPVAVGVAPTCGLPTRLEARAQATVAAQATALAQLRTQLATRGARAGPVGPTIIPKALPRTGGGVAPAAGTAATGIIDSRLGASILLGGSGLVVILALSTFLFIGGPLVRIIHR